MNIGIFTDTYFPQISGVATSIAMLQKELTNRGHQVYIFTTSNPEANDIEDYPNVYRIPSIPFLFYTERRISYVSSRKITRLVEELKLDIIHTQTEFSLGVIGQKVAQKYNLPLLHTYHTMYEDYLHYIANGKLLTKPMVKYLMQSFCQKADIVIAPTEKVKLTLEKYQICRPIKIIPTGIDFQSFEQTDYLQQQTNELKKELGLSEDDFVLVWLGRVAYEKNLEEILRELPAILMEQSNTKLVIVGDGPAKKDSEKIVQELGLNEVVQFLGEQNWENINKFYQLGNAFISASTTETQGLTYIEALASNLPVIAKRDSSIEQLIVDKQTGFLFEKSSELPAIIKSISQYPAATEAIIKNGREQIKNLSVEHFGDTLEEVYEGLLKEAVEK
ncbi:glycosyltransferase family 4 protein [Carnobacterium gallinarum]|uniref:glycosyltransferase family 4 protein n=1 Tax=Carnobacterium gallinarum TaxID=2749 RepID=UPI0005597D74|nr:glycosyltransferase family 4 protein [Carnobacterium gallinarum]